MDQTFELAANCLSRVLTEDRELSLEEKQLLAKMVVVALYDLHSVAASLKTIAEKA